MLEMDDERQTSRRKDERMMIQAMTQTTTHAELSTTTIRPSGQPASECPGQLDQVTRPGSSGGNPEPLADDAQPVEGPLGSTVALRLYRCQACGNTLVTAKCQDGETRLRNDWKTK